MPSSRLFTTISCFAISSIVEKDSPTSSRAFSRQKGLGSGATTRVPYRSYLCLLFKPFAAFLALDIDILRTSGYFLLDIREAAYNRGTALIYQLFYIDSEFKGAVCAFRTICLRIDKRLFFCHIHSTPIPPNNNNIIAPIDMQK